MILKNGGDKDVKLVKAGSSAAKAVELHNHINDGGVMKMRMVTAIDIKAKGEAALKPGGYHVMLIDMKNPLKEGDKVAITLGFDDGSAKEVEALVKKPEAPKAEMDHSQHKH
jgi:copper(I)-binding protein